MTRAKRRKARQLVPCLPEDAVDLVRLVPLAGIEVEGTLKQTHQFVLFVAAALGPDNLKALVLFCTGGQDGALVVGHA